VQDNKWKYGFILNWLKRFGYKDLNSISLQALPDLDPHLECGYRSSEIKSQPNEGIKNKFDIEKAWKLALIKSILNK
jgi:hypothetical protein